MAPEAAISTIMRCLGNVFEAFFFFFKNLKNLNIGANLFSKVEIEEDDTRIYVDVGHYGHSGHTDGYPSYVYINYQKPNQVMNKSISK